MNQRHTLNSKGLCKKSQQNSTPVGFLLTEEGKGKKRSKIIDPTAGNSLVKVVHKTIVQKDIKKTLHLAMKYMLYTYIIALEIVCVFVCVAGGGFDV